MVINTDGIQTVSNPQLKAGRYYLTYVTRDGVERESGDHFASLRAALLAAEVKPVRGIFALWQVHDREGEGRPLDWGDWERQQEDARNAASIRGQIAESESRFIERGERMTGRLASDDFGDLTDLADMED